MINNYIKYIKEEKPYISDYTLQQKINKAVRTGEIVKYHPNYADNISKTN
jgi:hypothetical protein